MQETNGELNKSLSKLTVQNAQAAKDFNDAGENRGHWNVNCKRVRVVVFGK